MKFAQKIMQELARQNKSQAALCEYAGWQQPRISKWNDNHQKGVPSRIDEEGQNLVLAADFLGVSVRYLADERMTRDLGDPAGGVRKSDGEKLLDVLIENCGPEWVLEQLLDLIRKNVSAAVVSEATPNVVSSKVSKTAPTNTPKQITYEPGLGSVTLSDIDPSEATNHNDAPGRTRKPRK